MRATMNSSLRPLKGTCKMLLVPYSAVLIRLCGKPSHFHRKLLIFLSRDSTVIGTA